jgi:hypothetical protein
VECKQYLAIANSVYCVVPAIYRYPAVRERRGRGGSTIDEQVPNSFLAVRRAE